MSDVSGAGRNPSDYIAHVNIYGAGIAGLTAAHELMERGFRVTVFERDVAIGETGAMGLALGGLARSQYLNSTKLMSHRWWDSEATWPTIAASPQQPSALEIAFAEDADDLPEHEKTALEGATKTVSQRFGSSGYVVTAHEDDTNAEGGHPTLAARRAAWVKAFLVEKSVRTQADQIEVKVVPNRSKPDGMTLRNVVIVQPTCVLLPSEHGFHFVPSYYRHVFDTLRRIPLLDAAGKETGRTVYDNLAWVPHQEVAAHFSTRRGYDPVDVEQFQLRMYRYLTTCPQRRAAEFEDISWWQFLTGWNRVTRDSLYSYAPQFERDIKFAGRVLAAFDAEWGDARTNGNTFVQLSLDQWNGKATLNGAMNEPLTEAWFKPWYAYLSSRGVDFVSAELAHFDLVDDEIRPFVVYPGTTDAVPGEQAEYYISATDVVGAEKVTSKLPVVGVPADLRGYTTTVVAPSSNTEKIVRNPIESPGLRPWDRLQTLSGVQFFFTNEFKLADGYVYFADADWALSSINPQQFWTCRPTLARDGFVSVLSVDVGQWNAPSSNIALKNRSAWQCNEKEIAAEVWRQVTTSLLRKTPEVILPQPVWFAVDQNIVFDQKLGTPVQNLSPYQIPVVGDWRHRPSGDPWNPTPNVAESAALSSERPDLWRARHGGYFVHWGKLLFAGTYMRTFTRMTTMESANESGRHAVNAILDHVASVRHGEDIARLATRPSQDSTSPKSNFNQDYARPSPVGDYSRIWDPELNEASLLTPLREYDALRFQLGLPHIWDSLGIEIQPSLRSKLRGALGWRHQCRTPDSKAAGDSILYALKKVRERMEQDLATTTNVGAKRRD